MNGFENRSLTLRAKASRSARGKVRVGMISSASPRCMNERMLGSSMHSRTVSLPARYAARTVMVWAPFRMRTLRSR